MIWAPPFSGHWDGFTVAHRAILRDGNSAFKTQYVDRSQHLLVEPELFPGERYQVVVTTISNQINSQEVEAFAVLGQSVLVLNLPTS